MPCIWESCLTGLEATIGTPLKLCIRRLGSCSQGRKYRSKRKLLYIICFAIFTIILLYRLSYCRNLILKKDNLLVFKIIYLKTVKTVFLYCIKTLKRVTFSFKRSIKYINTNYVIKRANNMYNFQL